MTEPRPAPQEPSDEARSQFRAVLTPHRSLGPKGFIVFMCAISFVSFGTGLLFYLLGAWPVMGFMGLDVLLVYGAFKLNFRALRLYETVDLNGAALTVTRVAPSGKSQSWRFNPYWVRISINERVGQGSELTLSSHGRKIVLGRFLSDPERKDFAAALKVALRDTRSPSVA